MVRIMTSPNCRQAYDILQTWIAEQHWIQFYNMCKQQRTEEQFQQLTEAANGRLNYSTSSQLMNKVNLAEVHNNSCQSVGSIKTHWPHISLIPSTREQDRLRGLPKLSYSPLITFDSIQKVHISEHYQASYVWVQWAINLGCWWWGLNRRTQTSRKRSLCSESQN